MPVLPAQILAHVSSYVLPTPVRAPTPVTTTLGGARACVAVMRSADAIRRRCRAISAILGPALAIYGLFAAHDTLAKAAARRCLSCRAFSLPQLHRFGLAAPRKTHAYTRTRSKAFASLAMNRKLVWGASACHVLVVVEWGRRSGPSCACQAKKPVILCAAESLPGRIATLMRLSGCQCILQLAYTH